MSVATKPKTHHSMDWLSEGDWDSMIVDPCPNLLPCCRIMMELRIAVKYHRNRGMTRVEAWEFATLASNVMRWHDMSYSEPFMWLYRYAINLAGGAEYDD